MLSFHSCDQLDAKCIVLLSLLFSTPRARVKQTPRYYQQFNNSQYDLAAWKRFLLEDMRRSPRIVTIAASGKAFRNVYIKFRR
jgi:hypothetical protein